MLNTQAPAFYRFQVGSFEATIVSDGALALGAPERTFFGPSRDEIAKMMTDHFLPADNMVLEQNALVINTGDKLALFETGNSSVLGLGPTDELARLIQALPKQMGRLTQNLKIAGIDPKDIDAVIPSHAHIDHIGGILAEDGSLNFPNAQIYISQVDFDYWTDEARRGTPAGVRAQRPVRVQAV